MNQKQPRATLAPSHEAIKERFFQAGDKLLRPIRIKLSDAYPQAQRMRSLPRYNPAVEKEYDDKIRLGQTFLYEQRNQLIDLLGRYDILPGKGNDSEAHKELVALVVDGRYDRLLENLCNYAPMLLPEKDAKEVTATLLNIFEDESKKLREFLINFRVSFRPGIQSLEAGLE